MILASFAHVYLPQIVSCVASGSICYYFPREKYLTNLSILLTPASARGRHWCLILPFGPQTPILQTAHPIIRLSAGDLQQSVECLGLSTALLSPCTSPKAMHVSVRPSRTPMPQWIHVITLQKSVCLHAVAGNIPDQHLKPPAVLIRSISGPHHLPIVYEIMNTWVPVTRSYSAIYLNVFLTVAVRFSVSIAKL